MIVTVTKVGYHDGPNGVHLIFIDDPALKGTPPLPSIAVWYFPETLEFRRICRGGKGITGKLKAAERRMWQEAIYRIVAQSQLMGAQKFEVELDI